MILPTLFRTKLHIKLLFKSGNTETFWVTEFESETRDNSLTQMDWTSVTHSYKPHHIELNEVEAVWIIGLRKNIFSYITDFIK